MENVYVRLEKFLILFGLGDDFSPDDLNRSYRVLAKLNHPDVNRGIDAEMRMTIINEGYGYLSDVLRHPGTFFTDEYYALSRSSVMRQSDPVFGQYKKAFTVLRNAFDDYFGENGSGERGDIGALREKLASAKQEFSKVINEFPYSSWVDDSIDKINSINKWLE
jgi:DnaJ-class molecular chaperone